MVKKIAMLISAYSHSVYEGALTEYRDICNYWCVEDSGTVTK